MTGAEHRRVAGVGDRDDTDPGGRVPRHVRAEPGISAAVAHDSAEPQVVGDEQAVAVAAAEQDRRGLGRGPRELRIDRAPGLLHLPAGRATERVTVVRRVARRERVGEAGDPSGEIGAPT